MVAMKMAPFTDRGFGGLFPPLGLGLAAESFRNRVSALYADFDLV